MEPENTWSEATTTLDEAADPRPLSGLDAAVSGQPMDGCGYVYAQVGWLDTAGNTYGLRLPDHLYHSQAELRPLYICLGRRRGVSADPEDCR